MALFVKEVICLNAHYGVCSLEIYGLMRSVFTFYGDLTLKTKNKTYRYNYTDSALMG